MGKAMKDKPKNPRRGTVKKTAPDMPAQFESGTAAAPVPIDCAKLAKDHNIYWKSGDGRNYICLLYTSDAADE